MLLMLKVAIFNGVASSNGGSEWKGDQGQWFRSARWVAGDAHRFVRRSLRSVRTAFKAASTSRRYADAAICQYASVVAPPAIDLAMSAISRLHDPRIDVATVIASDLWSSTD